MNNCCEFSAKFSNKNFDNINCSGMTEMELREILGPAYNPRYMSIQEPQKVTSIDEKTGLKRTIGDFAPNFYVDGDFGTNLDENDDDIALLPAWSTKYSLEDVIDYNRSREKRSPMSVSKRFKKYVNFFKLLGFLFWYPRE